MNAEQAYFKLMAMEAWGVTEEEVDELVTAARVFRDSIYVWTAPGRYARMAEALLDGED